MKVFLAIISLLILHLNLNAQTTSLSSDKLPNPFGIDFSLTGTPSIINVSSISTNSPASESEIKVGDIIIAMNGVPVQQNIIGLEKLRADLKNEVLTNVTFDIERKEAQKHTMRVTYNLKRNIPTQVKKSRVYGIGVTLILDTLKLNSIQRVGAMIDKVYEGSPADLAGLKQGDFIIDVDGHVMDSFTTDIIKQVVDWLLIDEPRMAQILILRNEHQVFATIPFKVNRTDISKYMAQGISNFPNLNIDRHPEENKVVPLKPTSKDSDGDGIPNNDDACPDEPGVETSSPFDNGCPEVKEGLK